MQSVREVVLETDSASSGAFSRFDCVAFVHLLLMGFDLSQVGRHVEQGDEDALGGDAAHATSRGLGQCLVCGVLHEAVPALDGVAQGGVVAGPLLGPIGETLGVTRRDVGRDGDRTLGTEQRDLQWW